MSHLIVLSNRVKKPDIAMAGGLAVAVFSALQQYSDGGIWLGWNGDIVEKASILELQKQVTNTFTTVKNQNIAYVTTAFTNEQYQHFYCGFANNVLWAMSHDRLDLMDEKPDDFTIYQQVNERFAKQLYEIAKPDDVIWVHDYHFFGVANYCRKLGLKNRIGFFLHIPFAPLANWQHISHHQRLLKQLAQYDVIGVQTQADKRHCQQVLEQVLTEKNSPKPLIEAYPIGVDVATIQQQISSLATKNPLNKIVAVDRVDYSKGILKRLSAFANFLRQYPAYQGNLQLHQIACPSRLDLPTYRELYEQVKRQVKAIQAEFASDDWQPIVYSEEVLNHPKLMALFFESQICWVNSLKDGMNLVAKEYISAQNPADAGVLLLSKYAGASEQMTEAMIIDPYDEQNLIESLHSALTMEKSERNRRYQALLTGLKQQDLAWWQQRFLNDLNLLIPPLTPPQGRGTPSTSGGGSGWGQIANG